jgi:hypothetical protein
LSDERSRDQLGGPCSEVGNAALLQTKVSRRAAASA